MYENKYYSGIVDDVEMTVFWKGSNCPNCENTCSSPGILPSILTSCLGSELMFLSQGLLEVLYLTLVDVLKMMLLQWHRHGPEQYNGWPHDH